MKLTLTCNCGYIFDCVMKKSYDHVDHVVFTCTSPVCGIYMVIDQGAFGSPLIIYFANDDIKTKCNIKNLIVIEKSLTEWVEATDNDILLVDELWFINTPEEYIKTVIKHLCNRGMIKEEFHLGLLNKYNDIIFKNE